MPTSRLAKHGWLLLFLAIAALYLYGLGALPLVGPDEPRYAEVAREILERRDFITPTLGGVPWFEKPPLLYWFMMASYRLLGVNEYAARLGPALCGLLTAVFIWWTVRNVEACNANESEADHSSQRTAASNWSALAFLSSVGAIVFSRAASFDITLTMTMTGALACFLVWQVRRTGAKNSAWLLAGFYFFIGLSLLAKGLVGMVLPFGVLAIYFVVRREWPHRTFLKSLWWGIPLALLIAGLWYGPMINRHGRVFLDQFFVQHHFARFVSNKYHHPQPIYFYLPILITFVLPWTVVLFAAFVSARKWPWRGDKPLDRLRVFALIWIVAPLIFFSLSGAKLPGYILPVLPAAALLVGERISCFLNMQRGDKVVRLTAILVIVVSAAGVWYSNKSLGVSMSWVIASSTLALIVAGVGLLAPRQRAACLLWFALMPLAVTAIALRPAARVAANDSVRGMIREADNRGYSSAPVFFMLAGDRTAEFYAGGRLVYQPNGEPFRFDGAHELENAIRQRGGAALVIIETRWETKLTDYAVLRAEKIANNGSHTLFVVRTG